ncbi:TIGR03943 family putative permease subunit [Clostridium sp. WILCCON 0269]|uniref:TIGR03943 family putative permease subunit n=1 Tax=Candidatus Clostridium eludens TaxID=3381663 RepID=A0ABW8SP29_9CLOT
MKRFNKSQFVWFLILAGFTIYFSYLIKTGKINSFLHPRMVKYTMASICGLIILMFGQFKRIFEISRNNKLKIGYILFFIPIILGFTAKGFAPSIASDKGVTLSSTNNTTANISNNTNANSTDSFQESLVAQRKNYIENGVAVFEDPTYYKLLDDISSNLNYYKGKKVEITGFVFKDKSFDKNQFVIARMMMTCCAVDAQVVGIMAQYDGAEALDKSEWVKIEGKIDTTMFKGSDSNKAEEMPLIIVEKIEPNQKPGSQYIYP